MNIVNEVSIKEWKSLLNNNENASIYHTPEWKSFLENTFNYKPYYLFALDNSGEVIGLLPSFYIKSSITGSRLISLPFSHICGPLGNDSVKQLLCENILNIYNKINPQYIEINDFVNNSLFKKDSSFIDYFLRIDDINYTWKSLKKHTRSSIKKSIDNSDLKISNNIDNLYDYYELNCLSKRKLGVPAHPYYYLKSLSNLMNDNMSIYLVKYKDRSVCGGVFLYFKDQIIYSYGASDPDYMKLFPNYACIWKSIEDGSKKGYKIFDFGRTYINDTNMKLFKKHWGTTEKILNYSYYPKNPNSIMSSRNNLKYVVSTQIIKKMPIILYKQFSNMVFENFG